MPASHKDVGKYIVGTGVLDCPWTQKFNTQKTRDNPGRFLKVCRGLFYSVR